MRAEDWMHEKQNDTTPAERNSLQMQNVSRLSMGLPQRQSHQAVPWNRIGWAKEPNKSTSVPQKCCRTRSYSGKDMRDAVPRIFRLRCRGSPASFQSCALALSSRAMMLTSVKPPRTDSNNNLAFCLEAMVPTWLQHPTPAFSWPS